MFSKLSEIKSIQSEPEHKENEIYKTVTTFGKSFELRYGYYEEKDRNNPLCKPVPIYPDFLRAIVYTDDGKAFVTMMQDSCEYYSGEEKRTSDTTCAECIYFEQGADWFGICTNEKNKSTEKHN